MSMKIYGSPMSRASRVMWCANELGVKYEHIDVPWDKLKEPDFLAINPNGKVPAFADGELKLFESLAINLYIAKKYGTGELYPTTVEDEARTFQWTLWAAAEIEPLIMPSLMVALGYSTDAEGAKAAADKLPGFLSVLEGVLKKQDYVLGRKFTVADLNLASAIGMVKYANLDISYAPHVSAWLDKILSRPARNPNSAE
jgi:glutathione S-transferase